MDDVTRRRPLERETLIHRGFVEMERIKRLPKSVHNPMRSSIILFDLPRVVEELIYNSVDASASKVFVSIGIKACYIKVEDDGCGITRDGMVILGERYATSKLGLLSDLDSGTKSLGFRGEALSSLSDVSLVEIRSKARGKPTAYCKILKGSKCLFLGIDDKREGVGTTVTVRDLFYNQPVRRKCMHSSPKRVLHAVKKCVLRTALVYPQVSFTVTDIESEDEVLATVSSSSPLPLVSDGFGNEVSSSLHEIVSSDKILVLSGYISGPAEFFSTKAFQYIYINSRFVCKGPIHNLLNNLAVSFQCVQPQRQLEPEFHIAKRQKTLGYPAFVLNLHCPLSSYDLNFEPSKTIVEFKDWDIVLSFFDHAIRRFWKQLVSQPLGGKTSSVQESPVSMKYEPFKEVNADSDMISEVKNMCSIEFHPNSHRSITSHLDTLLEDSSVCQMQGRPPKDEFSFSSELKLCQTETGYFGQTEYRLRDVIGDSQNVVHSNHEQIRYANRDPRQLTANVDSLLVENFLSPDNSINAKEKYDLPEIVWKSSPEEVRNLTERSTSDRVSSRTNDITVNVEEDQYIFDYTSDLSEPSTMRCSLSENKHDSSVNHSDHSGYSFQFDHLGNDCNFHDPVDALDDIYFNDFNSRSRPFQKRNGDSSLGFLRKCQATRKPTNLDSFTFDQGNLTEENKLHSKLVGRVWENSPSCVSLDKGWLLDSPILLTAKSSKTGHDWSPSFSLEENMSYFKSACHGPSGTIEEGWSLDSVQRSFDENYSFQSCTSPKRNMHYDYPPGKSSFLDISSSSKLDDGIDWLVSDSSNTGNIDNYSWSGFHSFMPNNDKVVEVQNHESMLLRKARSRRSHSAPPFYKGRHKFSILNDHLSGNDPLSHFTNDIKAAEDKICLSNDPLTTHVSQTYLDPIIGENFTSYTREYIDENLSTPITSRIASGPDTAYYNELSCTTTAEVAAADELEYAAATLTKWRIGTPQPTVENKVQTYSEQKDDILNISSGFLHLSGGSLIPESINKDFLEDARVLLQLDRKFIPVVAGGTLAVIDQHAADERIRLEELRQKVLSGEGSSVTYLDSEQKLVLPEMGFQLLQKYEKHIQKWGWICNTQSQSSNSFEKNMKLLNRRTCGVTLVAVPCILGINLTAKDLVEYIEQLVETDGSSTIPPSVFRVLNLKSCRGAIMFGDPLLPSECSLIVEELKATSLCFQCAHGRPTTVPLLNIPSLHEGLARLEMQNREQMEMWHGFQRHKPTIQRALLRLESAKTFFHG